MRKTLLRPWTRWLGGEPLPAERLEARTQDGVRLAIHRVRGEGPPVILCHGLASNSRGFHLPGRSFAAWLASQGFDCYLPDLRGNGESERRDLAWRLDDHVLQDVPAIVERVREVSGSAKVHWIGHSMGGILLFLHGILRPDAPIASGQALASALDYTKGDTRFRRLLALRPLLDRLPWLPYGTIAHLTAPLLGRRASPVESFNVWASNIEPEITRRFHALCFHTIPVPLLRGLATTFEERGMCLQDRALHFLEAADRYAIPTRLVAGSRDQQVAVAAVEHAARLLRGELKIHGKSHGDADEYGHWDLLLGARAEHEVWPGLAEWIRRHP